MAIEVIMVKQGRPGHCHCAWRLVVDWGPFLGDWVNLRLESRDI